VFGFQVGWEFPEADGVTRGVAGDMPGLGEVGLDPAERAGGSGVRGLRSGDFAVDVAADLRAWAGHLDGWGIAHSLVIEGSIGWLLVS
jgi:hypothetical protein